MSLTLPNGPLSDQPPFENALKVAGDLCFLHDSLTVEVGGKVVQ